MLNIKEKAMRFLEEFYVFEHVCAAMMVVDDIQDSGLLGPNIVYPINLISRKLNGCSTISRRRSK